MKKAYYLSTCSTCKKILKDIDAPNDLILQDIKTNKISPEQLDEMKSLSGDYESLFSRRAMKYRQMELQDKNLSEDDYRNLILEEYTFLKRPVFIIDKAIFIGSAKKTITQLKKAL
jgi:arsenate reductase